MIEASRRWFRRNRTNLAIGAGVIGAGYVAGQYVLNKIYETRQRSNEDRVAKDNLKRRFEQNQEDCTYTVLALLPTIRDEIIGALPVEQITEQLQHERQERLRRLGQSEAASSEFPSVPPSTTDGDGGSSSGSFVHASQMAGSSMEGDDPSQPKKSKAQLWQEMKINSMTRTLALSYTLALLTLLTRIQLNLLGRRTYLSSVVALASPPQPTQSSTISLENRDDDNYDNAYGNDFETNRKYLTFSWWILHRGSKAIMDRVMSAVKEVFGPVNIREDMGLERFAELVLQVRKKVEGASEKEREQMNWLEFLLPPKGEEAFVMRQSSKSPSEQSSSPESTGPRNPMDEDLGGLNDDSSPLRRLLDETSDLIESPTFSHVLTKLLDASFSQLVDYHIAVEAFQSTGPHAPGTEPRISEIPDTKCKLAHILPIVCRQAHAVAVGSGELDAIAGVAAQGSLGNEYLAAMDRVHDLEAFSAVIYSSHFDYEMGIHDKEESDAKASASRPAYGAYPNPPMAVSCSFVIPTNETTGQALPETQPKEVAESTLAERPEAIDPSVAGEKAVATKETEDVATSTVPMETTEKTVEGEKNFEGTQATEGEARAGGGFETAWEKALAREDGEKPAE